MTIQWVQRNEVTIVRARTIATARQGEAGDQVLVRRLDDEGAVALVEAARCVADGAIRKTTDAAVKSSAA